MELASRIRDCLEDREHAVQGVKTSAKDGGDAESTASILDESSPEAEAPTEAESQVDLPNEKPSKIIQPPVTPAPVAGKPPKETTGNARLSIRVDEARLDRLLDLIGELVITESVLGRAATLGSSQGTGNSEWQEQLARMSKLSREIHELAGSLRMVPVRATFRKMARLAHDVAKKADKRVNFKLSGDETELDKTMVDRMGDPLVHLIRNAIDHGIESDPEERQAAGKPEVGRVDLRAFHREGNIHIQIEDDGRGIDRDRILAKAIDRGLIRENETLSDREILQLICEPGFSTAPEITEISGRGVGMDVVKRAIEEMGGKLEITSEVGKGSIFTLHLPLTLAVIDGMVLQSGDERYIIPTLSVVRLVTPEPGDVSTLRQRDEVIKVHDELIPMVRLDRLFGSERSDRPAEMAVIAEADGMSIALMVDDVLGQQQVVIKSLDETAATPGISGCAIMPDGEVGLVLDPNGLVRLARKSYPPSAVREVQIPEPVAV